MRGALQKLTRLNAAKASMATVAFLALNAVPGTAAAGSPTYGTDAGAQPPAANATQSETVAYAVPRNAPSPGTEIVLPQPLPPSAVAQYRRIIALQEAGDYQAADGLISRLDDPTLLGAILAARYLKTDYGSSPQELSAWLLQYGSEPDAPAIYALLQRKAPSLARTIGAPRLALLPETTLTPGGAEKPSAPPENAAWRRVFARGIADWRDGEVAAAEPDFTRAASMNGIPERDRAAAAFWAARAALRLQRPSDYLDWLSEAAKADGSFYGMLAARLLGQGSGDTGIGGSLTEADVIAVDALPNGHLAFALLQVGAREEAAAALRTLWPEIENDPGFARSVMTVAARAGLVDVAIALAGEVPVQGNDFAEAMLPLPALHPDGGFTVDPPLVYALTRTESGFDAHAVSPAGARGLMQLMPVTANFVARDQGIQGGPANPSANLALGQGYLHYLAEQPGIEENLLAILASYNAGPNAAAEWSSAMQADNDPLLFIETIPTVATRRFVEQVLADSWIYAEEIGVRPRSLDQLAAGDFPRLSGYGGGIGQN
jgi:soluble lytic murein transglycosylase-like protein